MLLYGSCFSSCLLLCVKFIFLTYYYYYFGALSALFLLPLLLPIVVFVYPPYYVCMCVRERVCVCVFVRAFVINFVLRNICSWIFTAASSKLHIHTYVGCEWRAELVNLMIWLSLHSVSLCALSFARKLSN